MQVHQLNTLSEQSSSVQIIITAAAPDTIVEIGFASGANIMAMNIYVSRSLSCDLYSNLS
jgi:hypothetical protein